jgi:hypothetical protein
MFQHGPQAPWNLQAASAEEPDCTDGQRHKIVPLWRRVEEPQLAMPVTDPWAVNMTDGANGLIPTRSFWSASAA